MRYDVPGGWTPIANTAIEAVTREKWPESWPGKPALTPAGLAYYASCCQSMNGAKGWKSIRESIPVTLKRMGRKEGSRKPLMEARWDLAELGLLNIELRGANKEAVVTLPCPVDPLGAVNSPPGRGELTAPERRDRPETVFNPVSEPELIQSQAALSPVESRTLLSNTQRSKTDPQSPTEANQAPQAPAEANQDPFLVGCDAPPTFPYQLELEAQIEHLIDCSNDPTLTTMFGQFPNTPRTWALAAAELVADHCGYSAKKRALDYIVEEMADKELLRGIDDVRSPAWFYTPSGKGDCRIGRTIHYLKPGGALKHQGTSNEVALLSA